MAALVYFVFIQDDDGNAEKTAAENSSPDGELYMGDNFAKALDKLRAKEGTRPEILQVVIRPAEADFEVRKGERADGFRYYAEDENLEPVEVKLTGSGTLEGRQFSLARVEPGIVGKLTRSLREENPALRATSMTLERTLTDGKLLWTVEATGGQRTAVYMALPGGSDFADPAQFAIKHRPRPTARPRPVQPRSGPGARPPGRRPRIPPKPRKVRLPPKLRALQKKAECIRKARQDTEKIRRCLKEMP